MSRSIDKCLRKADLHMEAGETLQAEELYKKVLSQFPKNRKALIGYKILKTPPQVEVDRLIGLFTNNQLKAAVSLGTSLASQFPRSLALHEIIGAAHMGLGLFIQAMMNYQKVLELNPKHTDALNNLGMILYEQGKFPEAVESYQKAVDIEPDFADAHYNLGNSLKKMGDLRKAVESYRASLAINPNDTEVLSDCAKALKEYGEFEQAIEYYTNVLKINPNLPDTKTYMDNAIQERNEIEELIAVHHRSAKEELNAAELSFFKGEVLSLRDYPEAAIDSYNRALSITPDQVKAHYNIGCLQEKVGKFDAAICSYSKAIKIQPDYISAIMGMAHALHKNGCSNEALEKYERIISINCEHAEAHSRMGVILSEKEENERALKSFQKSIKIDPNNASFHHNLGIHLKKNLDLSAAIASFDEAIRLSPDTCPPYNNRGNCLKDIGKLDEAIQSFEQAIKLKPDFATYHFNMALCLIKKEQFNVGWQEWEWRWKAADEMDQPVNYKLSNRPIWQPNGKQRVLLWPEQGLGDEIMFASIIPDLYALCSKLIVVVDIRLIPLFKRSFPVDIDFRAKSALVQEHEYDAHLPMGSLPLHFRQTIESFQLASKGWLYACETRASNLRKKLISDGSETLIGISWDSNRPRVGAEKKLIDLRQLATKLHGNKIKLINLQYGNVGDELDRLRKEHNIEVVQVPEIDVKNDIEGLTALIMACDKVVSISNVTIHLAGALGKKAQVLLAASSDWRWGVNPNISHWYASVYLHRQTKAGSWDSVLKEL